MTTTTTPTPTTVELSLGGMTCASCAARIEKRLNKLDGVDASVNFALEKASVTFADSVSTDDLIGAVEAIGYSASIVSDANDAVADDDALLRARALARHREQRARMDDDLFGVSEGRVDESEQGGRQRRNHISFRWVQWWYGRLRRQIRRRHKPGRH